MHQSATRIIGRLAEKEGLYRLAKVTGTRSLLFVVGPSGIGKTVLTRSLKGYSDLDLVYSPYLEPSRSVEDAITTLVNALHQAGLRHLLAAALGDIAERGIGPRTGELVRALLGQAQTGLQALHRLLDDIASKAVESKTLVVALDEAQNLFQALESPVWSFVKVLATIQEEHDAIRFIIVTSDYFFYEKILGEAPSLDYIETFYLGEMNRQDANALYSHLVGDEEHLRPANLVDMIGGKPAHIKEVARYSDHVEKACSMMRRIYYALSTKISGTQCEDRIIDVLRRVASGPLPIAEYNSLVADLPLGCEGIASWLIDADILQFACKQYVGVYWWNRNGGGGLCGGLDIVAPSSRIAYSAIVKYLRDRGYRIKSKESSQPDNLIKSFNEIYVPDYVMQAIKTCF